MHPTTRHKVNMQMLLDLHFLIGTAMNCAEPRVLHRNLFKQTGVTVFMRG